MIKVKSWVKKGAGIVASALTLVASLSAVSPAYANGDTGGGTGGGGGKGSVSSVRWVSFSYDKPGKAWSEFLKYQSGNRSSTVRREVSRRVRPNGVQTCKNSKTIWVTLANSRGKMWVYNWGSKTDGSRSSTRGTIKNPKQQFGRKITGEDWKNFSNWERSGKPGSGKYHSRPGYVIVCSGPFDDVPPKTGKYVKNLSPDVKKDGKNFTHPVYWNASVSPQPIRNSKSKGGYSVDPIGRKNLQAQTLSSTQTEFGKLWAEVKKGKKFSPTDLEKRVKRAVDADKKKGRGGVNLNPDNIAGLSEGGVINVSEHTQYATVSSVKTTTTQRYQECTWEQTWNPKTRKWNKRVDKCGAVKKGKVSESTAMNFTNATQKETGFWQVLSMHCNPEGFNALSKAKAANGGKFRVQKNVADGKFSGVAYTPKYNNRPARLDFGDSTNPNKALAETGYLDFYDKECAFECVADPKAGDNVSPSDLAKKNIRGNSDRYGARIDNSKTNNADVTFFRDNELRRIQPDVWYPKSGKGVSYNGESAVTTTVSRWSEGTPKLRSEDGKDGEFGMFIAQQKDDKLSAGDSVFSAGKKVKQNQRNWDTTTGKYDSYAVLPGQVNDFAVQSTWASTAGKPQVFNFKWEYEPKVGTTIPTRLGFAPNGGNIAADNVKNVDSKIQGKCYAQFGSNTAPDYSKPFAQNTGTDTENNLDGNVKNNNSPESLTVKFIRATNE